MFTYDISDILRKKLDKLAKKDVVLARIFFKKVKEISSRDEKSVLAYKNLRSPMHDYKRVHLTDNYILLFIVRKSHIVFVDIKHRDTVYD
jgi:mRNA-degrading endonuclease RelE of RelBE toxin-antitoxin system